MRDVASLEKVFIRFQHSMTALTPGLLQRLDVAVKKMSSGVKSAMVEEPGKKLNLGRHFSGPNPGRIGQRSQAMEDTISTAGCKFLFSCFKQPGVRCILERDGSQVIIQHLKLIMRSASQPKERLNRTDSTLVMHTVGEECRKSVGQGRFSKPTVMPIILITSRYSRKQLVPLISMTNTNVENCKKITSRLY